MKKDDNMLNTPDLYSPCCYKSLMKPVSWKLGLIIYKCVRCSKRWEIKKTDINSLKEGDKNE